MVGTEYHTGLIVLEMVGLERRRKDVSRVGRGANIINSEKAGNYYFVVVNVRICS